MKSAKCAAVSRAELCENKEIEHFRDLRKNGNALDVWLEPLDWVTPDQRKEITKLQQRNSLKVVATLAVVASLWCAPPLQAQEPAGGLTWSKDPASHCEFVSPVSLTTGPTYWTGACLGNKASGSGMLRRRDGDRAGPAFYGEMQAGVPVIGVIDNEGYRVGGFKDGDIGGDAELEPQVRLDAFRAAAKAAREVAGLYAKQGNAASSRHYETIAQQLDMQIE